jgi:predicted enzyme related to lactoylglutathione lyase
MPDAKLPHAQGTPSWLDMFADDQSAALAFYHDLFGWTGEANPAFGGYAVLSIGERAVAGISPVMPDTPPRPVTWNTYFAVNDIAATADLIGKHGGTVFVGPDEVPGTGKLVFAADPSGAAFGLWQADPFPGFQIAAEPGAPVWFELETHEGKSCAEFYASVLGIEAPTTPEMPDSYWLLMVGGSMAAGIWQNSDTAGAPPRGAHWNPYFQVADTDAAVAAAIAAGASLVNEAKDSPYGRLAKLRDPQGAEFSVITPPAG